MTAGIVSLPARGGPYKRLPRLAPVRERMTLPIPWSVAAILALGLHVALGLPLQTAAPADPAPPAPEAAIFIDLPAIPDRPAAESVESRAAPDEAVPVPPDAIDIPPPDVVPDKAPFAVAELPAPTEPTASTMVSDQAATNQLPDIAQVTAPEAAAVPATLSLPDTAAIPPPDVLPRPRPIIREPAATRPAPVRKAERQPQKPRKAEKSAEKSPSKPVPARQQTAPANIESRAASGAGKQDPDRLARYLSSVRADIMRQRRSLRVRGGGKTAVVGFTIGSDGALSGIRIVSSSGSPELDEASLALVARASPVPALPAEVGRNLKTRLPVRFD